MITYLHVDAELTGVVYSIEDKHLHVRRNFFNCPKHYILLKVYFRVVYYKVHAQTTSCTLLTMKIHYIFFQISNLFYPN